MEHTSSPVPEQSEVKRRIKEMIVENLMLRIGASDISDSAPLFGPNGLGLDSVDALQLVVALEKTFGLKITDTSQAKLILSSVDTIASAVSRMR